MPLSLECNSVPEEEDDATDREKTLGELAAWWALFWRFFFFFFVILLLVLSRLWLVSSLFWTGFGMALLFGVLGSNKSFFSASLTCWITLVSCTRVSLNFVNLFGYVSLYLVLGSTYSFLLLLLDPLVLFCFHSPGLRLWVKCFSLYCFFFTESFWIGKKNVNHYSNQFNIFICYFICYKFYNY